MIVYISGPMTGYVDFNRPAFFAAEEHLARQGWVVVNPARADLEGIEDVSDWTHAQYLKRDLKMLLDCDAIYLLPGWRYSKGANIEHQTALACGIQILTETDLDLWRTFEGDPLDERTPDAPEGVAHEGCEAVEGDAATGESWCEYGEYVTSSTAGDLPAPGDGSDAPAQEEAEDLSAHPQWGDVGIEVDDTLPEDTLRLVTPTGHIDYHVTWDDAGMHLHPKRPETVYLLSTVEQPQPGDEFPNVGYVRRWRALRELRTAHNEGARRSA